MQAKQQGLDLYSEEEVSAYLCDACKTTWGPWKVFRSALGKIQKILCLDCAGRSEDR